MALEQIADRIVETDVLVVGGGIAGCPAAARAAQNGLKVTLAEKAKTDRSGSAAAGIDHFCGIYERGMTVKEFTELTAGYGPQAYYGGADFSDLTRLYKQYANGMWGVEELEKLGVPMRWGDGKLRPTKDYHWGGPMMRVHWRDVKPIMAKAARKAGVNVLERTMIIDLLTSKGAVVGATAIDTRTGEFVVIKAKATVLATAACSRVYTPETPMPGKYKFRYHWCPASVSGDGWAMAYRAGAELANLEQGGRGYRFRDDLVLSFGNNGNEGISAQRLTWDGEEFVDQSAQRLTALERQGKDPFYFSLANLPEDFHKRIEVAYVDERLLSFKIAEDRGFNLRSHWYEMMDSRPNQLHTAPGIWSDVDFKTTLNGLHAIGDCVAGCHDVANGSISGLLIADVLPTFVSKAPEPVIDEAQVESQKETARAPLSVKDGTEPIELEMAIRYICDRYVGLYKGEGRLREGLRRISSLRREFLPKLEASNPHELMRALEIRNIMDVAELHIKASLERKETWSGHIRLDYPEKDPSLGKKLLYQRLDDGKPVLEFRERPPMALPDDHKEER